MLSKIIWGGTCHTVVLAHHQTARLLVSQPLLKLQESHYFSAREKSVIFGLNHSMLNSRLNWQDWSGEAQPGFYALANPDEVCGLMQDLIVPAKSKNDWRKRNRYRRGTPAASVSDVR
ncbi:MAG: hypothetical protein KJ065_19735 [Anaerolineae bacterium]|nr:hypothetical protein [Anaerolineae bacterium]